MVVVKYTIFRAFYGWLTHCKKLKQVREKVGDLVFQQQQQGQQQQQFKEGVTRIWWNWVKKTVLDSNEEEENVQNLEKEIYQRIYYGGINQHIRKEVL